jgi:hypothetical protein
MLPTQIRYQLDPTGVSPDNLVQDEPHALVNRLYRPIIPSYGAYFTESLQITDTATGNPLTASQYQNCELYEVPSAKYGKEICSVILIIDPSVSANVTITYQTLGGEYSYSNQAILQQIEALQLDNRPIAWPNVLDKPDQYPPSMHLHDVGDVYGFEYVVHALDRIRAAIELGDAASHDAIYEYIDRVQAGLQSGLDTTNQNLQAHISDTKNPHKTTAAQVGAYTTQQSDTMLNAITDGMNAHINNTSNPHKVTAAQVGTYSSGQLDSMFSGTNTALNAHLADTNNPHKTTAGQVGLGNVPNYPMGTTTDYTSNNANTFANPPMIRQGIAAHAQSGDHDSRYIVRGATAGGDGNVKVASGIAYVLVNSAWVQFWPPVLQ